MKAMFIVNHESETMHFIVEHESITVAFKRADDDMCYRKKDNTLNKCEKLSDSNLC